MIPNSPNPYLISSFTNYIIHLPEINDKVENGEWNRADKDCKCLVCGQEYGRHRNLQDHPWLTVLCDKTLIKL